MMTTPSPSPMPVAPWRTSSTREVTHPESDTASTPARIPRTPATAFALPGIILPVLRRGRSQRLVDRQRAFGRTGPVRAAASRLGQGTDAGRLVHLQDDECRRIAHRQHGGMAQGVVATHHLAHRLAVGAERPVGNLVARRIENLDAVTDPDGESIRLALVR